ncbi:MAG TPA: Wzz/FepE/Etk N-terminal domain-containing protein [Solirubrobacteraceae bacterium]|nr:Wzz/FepE/Etk N-terminal domain-containing protein [Solirubrobacteraceae bacterium]
MNETTDATSILRPLWRRKWLILAVGIVVGVASYFYYKHQTREFQSSTQVYLGAAAEEAAPGEKVSTKNQSALVNNQVQIINSIVVEQVRQTLRAKDKALVRGSKIRAKAPEKSEFITITAEAHTSRGSALLANTTARTFIKRQRASRTRSIERAIAIARRQLRRIEAANVPKTVPKTTGAAGEKGKEKEETVTRAPSTSSVLQAASLNSKINQLESSLTVSGAQQIKPAKPGTAILLSPKPRKNAIFGFVVGIVLAMIAAYVLDRFDRRLRTLDDVEAAFGAQILTGLPKVRRPVVRRNGEPAPSRFLVEPLRRLLTALHLGVTPDPRRMRPSRTILFVSADAGDGKSTVVADLALVARDSGERVAIVEANLRRPVQAKLLGLDGAQGLAEVLIGRLSSAQAMQRVHPISPAPMAQQPVPVPGAPAPGAVATVVESQEGGSLFLLSGGAPVSNPPALLGHEAMAELLRSLSDEFNYVLIDAPSPLVVSDAIPLLRLADAVVVVGRAGHTREASAQRLVQLLAQSEAPPLGTVANCLTRRDMNRYGFTGSDGASWVGKLMGR